MANKYKLILTDDHLATLNDDPEMEGISLEAKDEAGNKAMVTLVKNELATPTEEVEDDTVTEEMPDALSDEEMIGNVAPEEEAVMQSENIGFTNESRIASFDQFLKS